MEDAEDLKLFRILENNGLKTHRLHKLRVVYLEVMQNAWHPEQKRDSDKHETHYLHHFKDPFGVLPTCASPSRPHVQEPEQNNQDHQLHKRLVDQRIHEEK